LVQAELDEGWKGCFAEHRKGESIYRLEREDVALLFPTINGEEKGKPSLVHNHKTHRGEEAVIGRKKCRSCSHQKKLPGGNTGGEANQIIASFGAPGEKETHSVNAKRKRTPVGLPAPLTQLGPWNMTNYKIARRGGGKGKANDLRRGKKKKIPEGKKGGKPSYPSFI